MADLDRQRAKGKNQVWSQRYIKKRYGIRNGTSGGYILKQKIDELPAGEQSKEQLIRGCMWVHRRRTISRMALQIIFIQELLHFPYVLLTAN